MTATPTGARGPVITGWAAVSPFGTDRKHFLEGVISGEQARHTTETEDGVIPGERGYVVPEFDARELLGRKGTRAMDKVTALAVAAVGQIFDGAKQGTDGMAPEGTALVLGTTTGSVQSMMDFTRSSLLGDFPYHVDPTQMPNTVMNCAAGRCAIWYRLTGPNATIASGRPSGLVALRYATRLLARERADTVLVGAAEEYSSDRSWLEFHGRESGSPVKPLGEGACVLLLEREGSATAGRVPLAQVLSVQTRVYPEGDLGASLRECVLAALEESGVRPERLWGLAPSGLAGSAGAQEAVVLDELFGQGDSRRIDVSGLIGDTGAASAAFQIAAALGIFQDEATAGDAEVAIISVDTDGTVACGVFRLFGART